MTKTRLEAMEDALRIAKETIEGHFDDNCAECRSALALVEAALALPRDDWRPIESAPKDGTEIDVWMFCHDAEWRPDAHGLSAGMRVPNARWNNAGFWAAFDDHWYEWKNIANKHYTVSHWMPLPTPPEPTR